MKFENICVIYDSCNGLDACDNNTGVQLEDFVSSDLKNSIKEASSAWDEAEKGSPEESAAENDYIKACDEAEKELEAIDFFAVVTSKKYDLTDPIERLNAPEVLGCINDQDIIFISKVEKDAQKFIEDSEEEDKKIDDYQCGRYSII